MRYKNVPYKKVRPEIIKGNRIQFKKIKSNFIRWCAYKGLFNDIFTKKEIESAKKGHLPNDCNIHHIMPLSGADGDWLNSFDNLCVLHKNTHKRINKEIFQPQLKGMDKEPFGSTIKIDIPIFERVDVAGIKEERFKTNYIIKNKRYFKRF